MIPFLDFGYERRLPVDRWLEECHLPSYLHEVPDAFIPTKARWKFVSLMARESDINDLGLRVAFDRALDLMGPRVLLGVLREPTLRRGIDEFARLTTDECSRMMVWTSFRGAAVRFHLETTFGPGTPGFHQTEWQSSMTMVTLVKLFAGVAWQPELVSLRSRAVIPPLFGRLFPDTRFVSGQPSAFVEFPRFLMNNGMSGFGEEVKLRFRSKSVDPTTDGSEADFEDSLREILKTYCRDGCPSLALAAEMAGMSTRTLQRRLKEVGLSYSTLIDQTRFEAAVRLLTQTDSRAIDVANATGYRDPSHFSRAFRRLAGCSPREFQYQRELVGPQVGSPAH